VARPGLMPARVANPIPPGTSPDTAAGKP
jgi:hypothetical protein